jgi:hypothetical protein
MAMAWAAMGSRLWGLWVLPSAGYRAEAPLPHPSNLVPRSAAGRGGTGCPPPPPPLSARTSASVSNAIIVPQRSRHQILSRRR